VPRRSDRVARAARLARDLAALLRAHVGHVSGRLSQAIRTSRPLDVREPTARLRRLCAGESRLELLVRDSARRQRSGRMRRRCAARAVRRLPRVSVALAHRPRPDRAVAALARTARTRDRRGRADCTRPARLRRRAGVDVALHRVLDLAPDRALVPGAARLPALGPVARPLVAPPWSARR
jgi:hypothetical protein